jgi:two-component system, chemotaxis family, response regulator Rcp1
MPHRQGRAQKDVLLVEDNEGDVQLLRRCFEKQGLPHVLHVVKDGLQARAFLRREGDYSQAPRPSLVLLDLNLPKLPGRRLLDEMKRDVALRTISVIVLSSSRAEQDIHASYELGANAYVTKPRTLQQLDALVGCIDSFWLRLVAEDTSDSCT